MKMTQDDARRAGNRWREWAREEHQVRWLWAGMVMAIAGFALASALYRWHAHRTTTDQDSVQVEWPTLDKKPSNP